MGTTQRLRTGSVEVITRVPPGLGAEFLSVYRSAFSPLETRSPARQALTDDEFHEAMDDESVVKFVGWDADRTPCAMALMATDLSMVPWVSPAYFAARFPEHHARGAVYYFHAILVRPEQQGGPWARLLLEELTRALAKERAVAAFDCCGHTVGVARLPEVIARVAGELSHLETNELDRQHYYAYALDGLR